MILIEGLQKSYDGAFTLAVDRLEIAGRGITILLGPNGSGKSTLVGILAGTVVADRGTIRMGTRARDAAALAPLPWRRRVTMLSQKPFLFGGTVRDNLAWGLKLRGVPRRIRRERIARALSRLGLDGFARRQARSLSGGEAQRVALARALVLEPRLLLLDEPTAHVDRAHASLVEGLIRALGEGGRPAIVVATHDVAQAHRLEGAVVFLDEGRVAPDLT